MKKIIRMILMTTILLAGLQCNLMIAQAAGIKKVSVRNVKQTAAKQVTVTWKKVSGASGYEIQYRLSGGEWTVQDTKQLEFIIDNLKVNKTYQIRVRAYKKKKKATVIGSINYGPFSETKKIKIKKMASSNSLPSTSLYLNTYYVIKSKFYSDRCLDINNWSLNNWGNLETYGVGRNDNGTTNQIFTITRTPISSAGSNWYGFRVLHSQKYLHYDDTSGSSYNVVQWDGCDHDNARWKIYKESSTLFSIYNCATKRYLYADPNGKNVCLRKWKNGDNGYLWSFHKVERPRFTVNYSNIPTSSYPYGRGANVRSYGRDSLFYMNIDISSDYPVTRTDMIIAYVGGSEVWRGTCTPNYINQNITVSCKIRDLGLRSGTYMAWFRSYTLQGNPIYCDSKNYYFKVN